MFDSMVRILILPTYDLLTAQYRAVTTCPSIPLGVWGFSRAGQYGSVDRTPVHSHRVTGGGSVLTPAGSVSREARVIFLVSHTFIYTDIMYTLYAPDLYYKIIKRVND